MGSVQESSSSMYPLTDEQKQHFLERGWLKIEGAFTAEQAAPLLIDVDKRLGVDLADKSTWKQWRTNLKPTRWVRASEFAPKAWSAICELSGGEDRLDPDGSLWSDGFIVNLGDPRYDGQPITPLEELDVWHVDGQFFVHYLDSTDQAILVVPLWTDVVPGGGPTALCPGSVATVAKWLFDHPEGCNPDMVPRGDPRFDDTYGSHFGWATEVARASAAAGGGFDSATGKVGDVYLLHPFLVHSTTRNERRLFRAITNSKTSLREPYHIYRQDGNYSILEQSIRRGLAEKGITEEQMKDWHIAGPREGFKPGLVNRTVPTKDDVTPVTQLAAAVSA
ncbi:hypothetical protein QBC46DRAFT_353169 [Diplogelasinospora grovesii]|uniref:Uncharacterized protein n=1 Tax=Diplogelasinospora grovesii TaxID=303347 RepID=A0AAN6S5T0_9PEZI|nr:hypothetical protein QBC46DRAFT_353169 [Diplogelasinospora grovesii]